MNEDDWFLNSDKSERGKYCLSYKLVFLYSLYCGVHDKHINLVEFERLTQASIDAIQNGRDLPGNYFSLYPIETTEAFLFIDHQHGCFPLILDGSDNKLQESRNLRKSAAIKSLKDIYKKSKSLYKLLSENQTWDQALQDQIMKEIPDPNTEYLEL